MEFVDSHCHLSLLQKTELEEVLARARLRGVTKMLCIGSGEGVLSAQQSVEIAKKYDDVWASIGIHPHDAKDFTKIEEIRKYAAEEKVVAIGECGLDFFRDWAPQDRQRELFLRTIEFALELKKPLIIHCRNAEEETLRILQDSGASSVGGVFHCYPGDALYAKELLCLNFLVSFTGVITFKNAAQRRCTLEQIPLEQLLLETDMPYMAPEPYRGKPSEPMHIYEIAAKVAEVKKISIEELAKVTSRNATKLFNLLPSSNILTVGQG